MTNTQLSNTQIPKNKYQEEIPPRQDLGVSSVERSGQAIPNDQVQALYIRWSMLYNSI